MEAAGSTHHYYLPSTLFSLLLRRRRLLLRAEEAGGELGHVVDDDEAHQEEQEDEADLLDALAHAQADLHPEDRQRALDQKHEEHAAVEHRDREQVEDAEVEAQEPEHVEDAVPAVVGRRVVRRRRDGDGAAHGLADGHLARHDLAQSHPGQPQDFEVGVDGDRERLDGADGFERRLLEEEAERLAAVHAPLGRGQLDAVARALDRDADLTRVLADVLAYLRRVARGLAVEREEAVARLQARLRRGRAFERLIDDDRLHAEVGLEAEVADLVPVLLHDLRVDGERQALAVAVDDHGQRLRALDRRGDVHPAPRRLVLSVEGDDAVAGLEAGRLRRAALLDLTDDRRQRRHAHRHRGHEWNRQRRQHVHHRPGHADQKLMPARAEVEALLGRNLFGAALFDAGVRVVAAELDVAAQWDEREAIVGRPPLAPPEALAEADRKGLDADAEHLRDDEVAELVQDDRGAEDEDESQETEHVF